MSDNSVVHAPDQPVWARVLLWQGILAPLLFAAIAVVGGALHPGYSHFSQAISELTAAGEPDKVFLDPALLLMEIMGLGFGVGVFRAVRHTNGLLKASASLLVLVSFVGLFFYPFPMDRVGSEMTFSGQMHMAIVSVSAMITIAAVSCAAIGWGRIPHANGLSRLSWILLAVMLFAGLAAIPVSVFSWPGIGLWQRANNLAYSVWQIATALFLLRHIGKLGPSA